MDELIREIGGNDLKSVRAKQIIARREFEESRNQGLVGREIGEGILEKEVDNFQEMRNYEP